MVQNGPFRLGYGQDVCDNLSAAFEASQNERLITFSNFRNNTILIGILSVNKNATNLSDTTQARFLLTSKFGETVGAAGGISTTNLQQAYNNSATPEIVTNSAEGALSIQNGTGAADNVTNLFEGRNTATSITSFIRADGAFSGSTYFGSGSGLTGIFNSVSINGITQFSANTNPFINFSGVNVNIVSGTNNTLIFSAGTGGGSPSGIDVFVTGGTYNGGQLLFTNNTGGTFTITGVTASGLSANYYGSFSDTTTQPLSGANTPTIWRLNTTELSNGISISGGTRIQVTNKGIYEIGYSAQIEKTQGPDATVTIWAKVNGNDVDRSSSTLGLVSNSTYQLPFVSYILDLNANDYVEFYFSSDNQYVQLTTLSGLTTPTRPVSPSLIVVAKQVGLSAGNSFTGGTVSGPTNFVSGLSANTISATTYLNLPTDVRVTGGTYSNGTATFTNNTGGTFNITGFTNPFTGGTVTGDTIFTNNVTATTISATTIIGDNLTRTLYRLPSPVACPASTTTTAFTLNIPRSSVFSGQTLKVEGIITAQQPTAANKTVSCIWGTNTGTPQNANMATTLNGGSFGFLARVTQTGVYYGRQSIYSYSNQSATAAADVGSNITVRIEVNPSTSAATVDHIVVTIY